MYRMKSTVSNTLPCGIQIVTLIDQTMVTAFLKGWSYIGCSPVIRDYSYFQQLPTDDGDREGQKSSEIDSMVLTLTILPQIETITLFSSKNFSGISIKVSLMHCCLFVHLQSKEGVGGQKRNPILNLMMLGWLKILQYRDSTYV